MTGLLQAWQHLPEKLDPVIFQIGNFKLQYYGLMYIAAFFTTYLLVSYRLKSEKKFQVSIDHVQGLMTYMIIGLIIGARLGYVLFYNLDYYIDHPLEILLPFEFEDGIRFVGISGMSYHGGLLCTIGGAWLYIRKYRLDFRQLADLLIPAIPAGYTFGRIGNFINGELWGRITDVPWGMYFPNAPGHHLRHPSQLYEALFEGLVLFAILWSLRNRKMPSGMMLPLYLIGYGTVRFCIEFFREPDRQLGFVWLFFSMGQLLCLAMIMAGAVLAFKWSRDARTPITP